jgi:hypothetical protein
MEMTRRSQQCAQRTFAEEAATPEKMRKQLRVEGQFTECPEALRKAQDEVETMCTLEQTQRIALVDELNSIAWQSSCES